MWLFSCPSIICLKDRLSDGSLDIHSENQLTMIMGFYFQYSNSIILICLYIISALITTNLSQVFNLRVSIALKRHYDQDNSYKGQHWIGAGLQVLRFSPLSSWWKAWQHPGKPEKLTSRQLVGRSLKAHSQNDTFLPTRPHLLILPLPGPYSNHHRCLFKS